MCKETNEVNCSLISCTVMNSNRLILEIKPETKTLGGIYTEKHDDIGFGSDFLSLT